MIRENLQTKRTAYPNQSLDSALSAPSNQQLNVHSLAAINGSAAENKIAIAHSQASSYWQLLATVGGAQSNVTTAIQGGVSTSAIGTTANDELLIESKEIFSLVAFDISQAETGSPVYVFKYWNGSSYTTLNLINTPSFGATGKQAILFEPPTDWAAQGGFYAMKVVATTAPSQAIKIDSLKVCEVLSYRDGILPKGELLVRFETRQLLLQQGEEIIPFFAFPSTSNTMEASYQISP